MRDDPTTLLPAIVESGFTDLPTVSLRAGFPTALAYLEQIGGLTPGSTLRTVWCTACDRDHDAKVELNLTGSARHFCPEAGWVDDNDEHLASLRLDREWLLEWLQRIFSVLPPRRRQMLLTDRVWHIGEAVLGKTSLTIVFCRGFVRRPEFSAALAQIPPTEVGIVITTAAEVPSDLFAAHGYSAVNLGQILPADAGGLAIDQVRFAGLIRAIARKTRPLPGPGGRRSEATLILDVFRRRRARRAPYQTKSAEAKEIIAEWPDHYPELKPPGNSTIRKLIPNL